MAQQDIKVKNLLTIRRPRLQRKLRLLLARNGATEVIVTGDDGTLYYVTEWPRS